VISTRAAPVVVVALLAASCRQPDAVQGSSSATPSSAAPASAAAHSASLLHPDRLRCEDLDTPLAIATPHPRLSWTDVAAPRDAKAPRRRACQLLVASTREALAAGRADRWDSGRVEGDTNSGVAYGGPPLRSRERVFWTVRVWDEADVVSKYAEPASFAMGLNELSDWKAEWIGFDFDRSPPAIEYPFAPASWIGFANDPDEAPAGLRLYQATFTLPPAGDPSHAIEQARLLATADDRLSVALNGREVVHEKRHPERVADLDVAADLRPGDNDVRVLVRNDVAGPAGALLRLDVRTSGGAEFELVSDGSWRGAVPNFDDWATHALAADAWPHARVVGPYGCAPWKTLSQPELFLPPTALLRRRFTISRPFTRAVVYVSALGLVDVELNGERVSDDRFTPGGSEFEKRAGYRAFDVTGRLKPGENALIAELADGAYCGYVDGERDRHGKKPRAKLQLCVDAADGTLETIASDRRWEATRGPRREADLAMGEWYDANAHVRRPAPWKGAAVGAEIDPPLAPDPAPPVRITAELVPAAMRETSPGTWLFDVGREIAGVARLKVHGRAGQTITLRFAAKLDAGGALDRSDLRGARATDRFTCSGLASGLGGGAGSGAGRDGFETFEPRFTLHDFRYVEVTGLSEPPTEKTITGVELGGATPPAAR
jgi:alpha-L-rhamnosidase